MHSKLNSRSVEAGPAGNYPLKAKNNKLPGMKSGKFIEHEGGGRRRWIYFNALQNSSKDAPWDHHVIACAASEIHVMCSRQFPSPKSLKMTLIMKDQLFDPWFLLYSADHMSQIMPCGPWKELGHLTIELY